MTVADSRKYRVILSGGVLPEKSRAEVVEALAVLFNSQRDTMEQLLRGKPVPLTKRYEREQADKICRAIRQAGAECAVEEIRAPEASVAEAAEAEAGASATATDATEPPPDDAPEDEAAASAAREESSEDAPEETPEEAPEEAAKQAAVARFVEVNTDYYLRQFAKFGGAERCAFALSWHWPAFLAFFFWAVHRKLWLWAGAHLFGSLILLLAFQPGIVYLIWALVWPLTANYLYCRRVRDCVFGDPGAPRRTDFSPDADLDSLIHGGVSRVAVALAVLLMFVVSLALNSPLSERVLQYSERGGGGGLLPAPPPGSRQRGDGSSIEDGAALTPRVATTVTLLNGLAAALKLAASDITPGDRQQALFVFRQVVARAKVKDAWGTAIAIQEDAAGQVALVSAGPDGRFDSDDDIVQYIRADDG